MDTLNTLNESIASQNNFIKNTNKNNDTNTRIYNFDDKSIIVCSNFLSTTDFNTLKHKLIIILKNNHNYIIKYDHSSIGWHPFFTPHWSTILTDDVFFSKHIMSKIRKVSDKFTNLKIKRIYCSFQTSGQDGNWHYDDDCNGSYTVTIYCNISSLISPRDTNKIETISAYTNQFNKISDIIDCNPINSLDKLNHSDTGGEFTIKFDDHPTLFVRTHDNNAVFFDSKIMHNGISTPFDSTSIRCVVAYKLYDPYFIHQQST
jgi:hypothetical protein